MLRQISESGPLTAAALAETLGLTAAAVRRHLDHLEQHGEIATSESGTGRRGRGRPARAYVLTPLGHSRMNTTYDDVARAALRYLADHIGVHAVADFAGQRAGDLEERYREPVELAGPDPAARAHALARALALDGFAASARPVQAPDGTSAQTGVQLCQGHCPMHQVALQFPQFCEAEAEAFARLLGVDVQRLATLANGEHVCTTFVPVPTADPAPTTAQLPPAPSRERTGS